MSSRDHQCDPVDLILSEPAGAHAHGHAGVLRIARRAHQSRPLGRDDDHRTLDIVESADRLGKHGLHRKHVALSALAFGGERIGGHQLVPVDLAAAALLHKSSEQIGVVGNGNEQLAVLLLVGHAASCQKLPRVVVRRRHDGEGHRLRSRAPLSHQEEPERDNDREATCQQFRRGGEPGETGSSQFKNVANCLHAVASMPLRRIAILAYAVREGSSARMCFRQ